MVKFINQRNDKDCVYACIAMVCGVSYEDVMNATPNREPLCEIEEFQLIAHFKRLPISVQHNYLYANGLYSITVPSLNFPGVTHRVVIRTLDEGETAEVYDPQYKREGKKWYTSDNLKCWGEVTKIINCENLHVKD